MFVCVVLFGPLRQLHNLLKNAYKRHLKTHYSIYAVLDMQKKATRLKLHR